MLSRVSSSGDKLMLKSKVVAAEGPDTGCDSLPERGYCLFNHPAASFTVCWSNFMRKLA